MYTHVQKEKLLSNLSTTLKINNALTNFSLLYRFVNLNKIEKYNLNLCVAIKWYHAFVYLTFNSIKDEITKNFKRKKYLAINFLYFFNI